MADSPGTITVQLGSLSGGLTGVGSSGPQCLAILVCDSSVDRSAIETKLLDLGRRAPERLWQAAFFYIEGAIDKTAGNHSLNDTCGELWLPGGRVKVEIEIRNMTWKTCGIMHDHLSKGGPHDAKARVMRLLTDIFTKPLPVLSVGTPRIQLVPPQAVPVLPVRRSDAEIVLMRRRRCVTMSLSGPFLHVEEDFRRVSTKEAFIAALNDQDKNAFLYKHVWAVQKKRSKKFVRRPTAWTTMSIKKRNLRQEAVKAWCVAGHKCLTCQRQPGVLCAEHGPSCAAHGRRCSSAFFRVMAPENPLAQCGIPLVPGVPSTVWADAYNAGLLEATYRVRDVQFRAIARRIQGLVQQSRPPRLR